MELDSIINNLKKSYQKSNLLENPLESLETTPEKKIGYIIEQSPHLSTKIYANNFDPVQNLYLNHLIRTNTLDHRIIFEKSDFFKGIAFLDYFTHTIITDKQILTEMYDIAKKLERKDRTLDPDLPLVVHQAGIEFMYINSRTINNTNDRAIYNRYYRNNKKIDRVGIELQNVSALYQALGAMVYSLANEEFIKETLPSLESVEDIKASLFIDSIFPNLPDNELKESVITTYCAGRIYKASIFAIAGIGKEVATKTIDEYITKMVRSRG